MNKNIPFNSALAFGIAIVNTLLLLFLLIAFKKTTENTFFMLLELIPFVFAIQVSFISYFEYNMSLAKFYRNIAILGFVISALVLIANVMLSAYGGAFKN